MFLQQFFKMNNKKKYKVNFILCFFLIISPIIYTEIIPWIFTPFGFEYTPVNSFSFRRNDTYFYASFFNEICDSGIIFGSPSTDTITSEISQYSYFLPSNLLISIGCLFDFDFRLSFIIAYLSGLLILFIFLNKIFYVFLNNKNFSYILSIIFILYSKPLFQDIQFFISDFDLLVYLKKFLINYLNPIELDSSNQILRFFNFSHHIIYFIIMIYYTIIFFLKKKNKHFIKLTLLSSLALLQYPPLALINYLFIYINFFFYGFLKEKKMLQYFFFLSLVIILVYIPTGILNSYLNVFQNRDVADHLTNTSFIFPGDIKFYFNFLFNKYIILSVILYFTTKNNPQLHNFAKSIILITVLFLIFKFIPNNNFEKFFYRGLDFILIIFLVIIIFNINFFKKKFFIFFIIFFLIINFNLINTTISVIKSNNRYIEKETFMIFEYLGDNYLDKKIILTNDWQIIDLIPIYTIHNVFYGHKILNYRKSKKELEYYIAGNLILGKDKLSIIDDFKSAQETFIVRENKAVSNFYKAPFVNKFELNRMNIVEGVLYAHYVKKIENINILNSTKTDFTKSFFNYLDLKIDEILKDNLHHKLKYDLIVINKNLLKESNSVIEFKNIILETKNYLIYEKK